MFPHQLGVEKSGIRKGLSTPGSSFCCITSKQNTCPFDNLNVGQIYPQFCPPPPRQLHPHLVCSIRKKYATMFNNTSTERTYRGMKFSKTK